MTLAFEDINLVNACFSDAGLAVDVRVADVDAEDWSRILRKRLVEILMLKLLIVLKHSMSGLSLHLARVAELGSLSSGAKMDMKIFVKRIFTIFASNASFLRVIANLLN